ncbi:HAD-IIB family hydrolase [Synechococcus sp. CBW1108]|uniref:HAD-IIB family hydrolase n=1 Tax=Synechococcus sp. CBW1108 TaxID=1353147 RepID=UPI0018CD4430|nr:HAD-IIB family hydrolase [Synechococcus sp. CBW1108]QPN70262.1 HAD-IIB family hydrolase [Synechococcus sp. CBW1108]
MTRLLICTDLDRTLLPNGDQEESPLARERFAAVASQLDVTLAYVSGRDLALVTQAIDRFSIPLPDWVIGDVGSGIYRLQDQDWIQSSAWQEEIALDWPGLVGSQISEALCSIHGLVLQEPARQSRYKLSYYLPLDFDLAAHRPEIEARLQILGARSSLIHSIDEQAQLGLLDVLPLRATKLHAVEFVMQQVGITAMHTVFAGDSGNDLPILISSVPSVVVANANQDLIRVAETSSREQGLADFLYVAKGNLLGMNGNYSAGILEGLVHYHPETKDWIV